MNFNQFRDINWQLLFIRTYTWISYAWNLVQTQSVKTTKYLVLSFKDDIYALYKGASIPVRIVDFGKDVAGVADIDFYYNRETKIISNTLAGNHLPRTLNIEGASIYHGDMCLYDLTDFFDTTRYAGSERIPNLDQWVGIWELENRIYLDRNKEFELHVQFLGASNETFSLWVKTREDRWAELTSSSPRLHRQVFPKSSCSCAPTTDSSRNTVCMPSCEAVNPESAPTVDLSGNVLTDLSGNRVDEEQEEQGQEKQEEIVEENKDEELEE